MHSERTLVELVGLIYEAAGDSAQWTPFLERLGKALKTPWCVFHVHDLAHRRCDVAAEIGFDPAFRRSYEEYFVSRNVFLIHGRHQLFPGNVCPETALCPDDVLFRSEFYNDWIAPQGMLRGINACVLNDRSLVSLLGFIRERRAEGPDEHDVTLVRELMPHLQRAVQMHQHWVELRILQHAAQEALDRWTRGVIILGPRGRVLLMNRSAEEIVKRKDALTLADGSLRASYPAETARLRTLIQGAIGASAGPTSPPGGALSLSRSNGQRPLQVLVVPASPTPELPTPRRSTCVVFVTDPDARPQPDEAVLRHLYGLTPAESRVAALLAQGRNLHEICERLRVRANTARTHVQRVLRKTNTHRQAELARLLLSAPTAYRLK